jgi:hypothetical protein
MTDIGNKVPGDNFDGVIVDGVTIIGDGENTELEAVVPGFTGVTVDGVTVNGNGLDIPLSATAPRPEYAGIITVAAEDPPGAIQDAIDSILDATVDTPYCIRVMPGTYTENVVLKDYVDLQGIGGQLATIEGSLTWPATACTDGAWSSLDNITIQNTAAAQGDVVVVIEAGWHYLTNCYIYGVCDGVSMHLVNQSGGAVDYLLTAFEYEHTGADVVGAGLGHVGVYHTGGLYDCFYSEMYMSTECTLQKVVAFLQNGNVHSVDEVNRFGYAPIVIYTPAGFTKYAAAFDIEGDSTDVLTLAAHITLIGTGGTGAGRCYDIEGPGVTINSSGNIISVTGYLTNLLADISGVGAVLNSYDTVEAPQGVTGIGAYHFVNNPQPGYLAVEGNITVGGSVDGRNVATDGSKLDGIEAGAQVNVATNIAQGVRTTTTVPITSSTGSSATLDVASTTLAGVMSSADKVKLDGIEASANNYSHPTGDGNKHVPANSTTNAGKFLQAAATAGDYQWADVSVTGVVTSVSATAPITSSGGTTPDIAIPAATALGDGYATSTQISKLDGIEASANNYTHPSGDGNLHVPANGTGNTGKVLTASGTAGVYTWESTTGGGTVTAVSGSAPVVSSGGNTPQISMAAATALVNGYMTSTYAGKLDTLTANSSKKTVNAVFGDGYAAGSIVAGLKTYVVFPLAGTITGWRIISNAAISSVVDVWKAAGAIPTVANTITASAKPTLTGATVASGAATGWTTSVAAGDVFGFNLDSFTGSPTQISVVVEVTVT